MEGSTVNDYLTIKDFCSSHSHIITEGSLRWILWNTKKNGADYFVRRLGEKRILISPKLFMEWLDKNKR